jgi:hypothetical protein
MRANLRTLVPLLALLLELACGGENPMSPSSVGGGQGAAPAAAPKAAPAAAAKPPDNSQPLYDPRDRTTLPPGVEREPKLAPEIEKIVLAAVSPTYKTKREECQGAQDTYQRVVLSAPGSFTAAAKEQTAYVVESLFCEPPSAQQVQARHVVFLEGDKLLGQGGGALGGSGAATAFAGTLVRARPDVDGDGVRELLVTSSEVVEGAAEETASLYSARGGDVKLVKAFPGVYVDACHGGKPPRLEAKVLRFVAGAASKPPQFLIQAYKAPCPTSGEAKPTDFKPVQEPAKSPAPSPADKSVAPPASPSESPAASPSPAEPAASESPGA